MFDFNIQLAQTNELLTRIANALEAAVGPALIPPEGKFYKRGPEAIKNYGTDEKIWLRENFTNLVHQQGRAPAQEQEMLDQAMAEYDQMVEDEALEPPSY